MKDAVKFERPSKTAFGLSVGVFLYISLFQWWLFPDTVASKWDTPVILLATAIVLRLMEAFWEWKDRRS